MEHKKSFDFEHIKLPEIKFESDLSEKGETSIIALVNKTDEMPEIIKKYIARERINNDLKSKKFVVFYADNKEEGFEKCSVFLADLVERKDEEQFTKKVQNLACKISKFIEGNKLTLLLSDTVASTLSNGIGVLLNALTLCTYEFDRREKKIKNENKPNPINLHTITVVGKLDQMNGEEDDFQFKSSFYSLLAREISSERPNIATTLWVRDVAKAIAETHSDKVTYQEIVGKDLEKQGLNLLYSVGKASSCPPVLASLYYQGNKSKKDAPVVALVGKGIVFDAGGLSIKTTSGMETMYCDKVGACSMLSVFRGAVEMSLPINLVCTIAVAENVIGPDAYRNSDIITSLKGLTVEIKNTDAEGRLVLADAMTWTQKNFNVERIIDMATLTGACSAALGDKIGGLFTNADKFADRFLSLSKKVNEPLWRLPLTEDNVNYVKGAYSDLQNTALGKHMGASNAAAFLLHFVEKKVKWVHLDVAGPAYVPSSYLVYSKGITGFGVRLILTYLRFYSKNFHQELAQPEKQDMKNEDQAHNETDDVEFSVDC